MSINDLKPSYDSLIYKLEDIKAEDSYEESDINDKKSTSFIMIQMKIMRKIVKKMRTIPILFSKIKNITKRY